MAGAFTFNGIDMSAYGLTVTDNNASGYEDSLEIIQTKSQGYISGEYMPARSLILDVFIQGTSIADLKTKLDDIVAVLRTGTEENLVLDDDPTKLFSAHYKGKQKQSSVGLKNWQGTLSFLCPDPLAYSTTETSSNYDIDADPKTITETVGGTAITKPVWTLTAGETLTDVTISLKNYSTDEELTWTGSLATGDELEIDSATQYVKKNGTIDMAAVDPSKKFPRLAVGVNSITVTGFSTTGTLNITYRDAYI